MLLWRRYIDGIFIFCTGPSDSLLSFVDELNINNLNLKFTFSRDNECLLFVDLYIKKDNDGLISTDVFWKTTAGNSLLHYKSAHSSYLINLIHKGHYLQAKRNCSNEILILKPGQYFMGAIST